jgi:site-specific recombinase XerD
MDITETTLERFTDWLVARGRGENTADVYCCHLRKSAEGRTLTHRLIQNSLSPNARRTNLAALKAWAKFTKDSELREVLDEIRLPPARRITTKVPLTSDDWRKLIRHLKTCKIRSEPLRHLVLIIAKRGLRCSDALRLRRKDCQAALRTGKITFEGKGRKRMEYGAGAILDDLAALAKIPDWDHASDLVCASGKRASAAKRIWRTIKVEAGKIEIVGAYPHQLRRTYATYFLQQLQGDPQALIKLQQHMWWEDLSTAASYADAVNADELAQVGDRMMEDLLK